MAAPGAVVPVIYVNSIPTTKSVKSSTTTKLLDDDTAPSTVSVVSKYHKSSPLKLNPSVELEKPNPCASLEAFVIS